MSDNLGNLKKLGAVLSSKPIVAFAYLFGSRAKGYADERSDWDIAVYFSEPPEDFGIWTSFELEAELSRIVRSNV